MLALVELDEDYCIADGVVLFEGVELIRAEAEVQREDYILLLKLSDESESLFELCEVFAFSLESPHINQSPHILAQS